MKIVIRTTALQEALESIKPVMKVNNSIPALDCVLLDFTSTNILILKGSNLETTIQTSIYIESSYNDIKNTCINFNDLYKIIKLLNDDNITLSFNDVYCTILTSNGSVNLPLELSEDFPDVEPLDKSFKAFTIGSNELVYSLSLLSKHLSVDELRPVMNGYSLQGSSEVLTFAATDGMTLATINQDTSYTKLSKSDIELILLPTTYKILKNLAGDGISFTFSINKSKVEIETPQCIIYSRLIEGQYPKYQNVIPKYEDSPVKVKVNTGELLSNINKAQICANATSSLIVLDFAANRCKISSHDIDFNKSCSFDITCEALTEECITIGVRYSKIIDILSAYDNEDIVLYMTQPGNAIIFIGENEDILQLQMPLMIKQD